MTRFKLSIPLIYFYFLPLLLGFGWIVSCNKINGNNDVSLRFSTPIVSFDTVFTSIGSITKKFTVHNRSNNDVSTTIFLAQNNPYFSINVDGEAGTYFKNVKIPRKDSLFVFVKVNIDPKNDNLPFLVTDSIVFLTGSHTQDVKLLAYGQDAHYIVADPETGYKIVAGEHQTVKWSKDRPYVVYGWAVIDSLGTLEIESGTKVYFHKNSELWAYRYSTLKVEGALLEPVLFRGDRLEAWYDKDYAQWNRIWINEGATVTINNALITNAFIGVQVEPLYPNGQPITVTTNSLVKIENTFIQNTKSYGVMSRFLNVEMVNCVIANNGACSLQLEGGQYTMKHLTIANYFMQAERKTPACYVSNIVSGYYDYPDIPMDIKADFINCIIYGRNETEIEVNKKGAENLVTSFQNCLIKSKNNSEFFIDCLRNEDPKFENIDKLDFRLQSGSPAIGKGKNIGVLKTILEETRSDPPDIGAY